MISSNLCLLTLLTYLGAARSSPIDAVEVVHAANSTGNTTNTVISSQPLSFAVLPVTSLRNYSEPFVPPSTSASSAGSTSPPYFEAFHPNFTSQIISESSTIRLIANYTSLNVSTYVPFLSYLNVTQPLLENFSFAHEAPTFFARTGELFFTSNGGGSKKEIGAFGTVISKLNLSQAIANAGSLAGVEAVNLTGDPVVMTNGGTLYTSPGTSQISLAFTNQGRASTSSPSTITLVNPYPPYNSSTILNNFFGRPLNSLNDIVQFPKLNASGGAVEGVLFFTDPSYAYFQGFGGPRQLPTQVYRFDTTTGDIKVVADGLQQPNGIAFSPDASKVYISDTASSTGYNGTQPSTIYVYDVDSSSGPGQFFTNKRVFAYSDYGLPDGIKVDSAGNVHSGCFDGIHVWSPIGTLLGKFYFGKTSSNLVFVGDGNVVAMADDEIYLVSGLRVNGAVAVTP